MKELRGSGSLLLTTNQRQGGPLMQHDTTALRSILAELCSHHLRRTEDLASAEPAILDEIYGELRLAMAQAMECFDETLASERELGWVIKDRRSRTLFTEFGEVTYVRRVYIDEYKDRRYLLDDVLDIAPRHYISANAFSIVCRFAADIPYARAAGMLCRHTGSEITASGVMGCLRKLGSILKERDHGRQRELFDEGLCPKASIIAAEVSAEADGIWVHLQRERARSVELKAFCAYQGKEDGRRLNTVHHAAICEAGAFTRQAIAKMAAHFSLPDIRCVYFGSDGESWCKAVPDFIHGPKVVASLDPWHINRMIDAAFPLRTTRARVYDYLKTSDVSGLISYLKEKATQKTKTQDKVKALLKYISNNRSLIAVSCPSLGTQEGTNAHVYAARMKVWGGGWSRRGASDMARIRSTLFSGEELPKLHQRIQLSRQEQRRREALRAKWLEDVSYNVPISEGKGYEMPQGHLMPFSSEQSRVKFWPEWSR